MRRVPVVLAALTAVTSPTTVSLIPFGGPLLAAVAMLALARRPTSGSRVALVGVMRGRAALARHATRDAFLSATSALASGVRRAVFAGATAALFPTTAVSPVALPAASTGLVTALLAFLTGLSVPLVPGLAVTTCVSAVPAFAVTLGSRASGRSGVVRASASVPVRVPLAGVGVTLLAAAHPAVATVGFVAALAACIVIGVAARLVAASTVRVLTALLGSVPASILSLSGPSLVVLIGGVSVLVGVAFVGRVVSVLMGLASVLAGSTSVLLPLVVAGVASVRTGLTPVLAGLTPLVTGLVPAVTGVPPVVVASVLLSLVMAGMPTVLVGLVSVMARPSSVLPGSSPVLAGSVLVVVVSSGPALVVGSTVVVQSSLVGLVASSVFSMRICHWSPPEEVAGLHP